MKRINAGTNSFRITTATPKEDTKDTPVTDSPQNDWSSLEIDLR
jgi:hypothetical protein